MRTILVLPLATPHMISSLFVVTILILSAANSRGFVATSEVADMAFPEKTPAEGGAVMSVRATSTSERQAIGDHKRSPSASFTFFSHLDLDGDGKLAEKEVASFLWDEIGGADFDSTSEVNTEVDNVIRDLDVNHDKTLDRSDIFQYWAKMETLLTCEEVADWVVFAVQLPESIGRIFRENGVTGYDFPELVENDGVALASELHLEKSWVRKKLVRHIRARMLGVGERPSRIANLKASYVQQGGKTYYPSGGCITLSWNTPTARGFPVHSYRIQRAVIELDKSSSGRNFSETSNPVTKSNNNSCTSTSTTTTETKVQPGMATDAAFQDAHGHDRVSLYQMASLPTSSLLNSHSSSSTEVCSNWVTVYLGADNEFVDTDINVNGYYYVYRVQAWNAAGRSAWTNIDVFQPRKEIDDECVETNVCNTTVHRSALFSSTQMDTTTKHWTVISWSILSTLIHWVFLAARTLFAIGAVTASIVRYRRASVKSTASVEYLRPVAPWLWRLLNSVSSKALGVELVPSSILQDEDAKTNTAFTSQQLNQKFIPNVSSSSRRVSATPKPVMHYSSRVLSSPLLSCSAPEVDPNVTVKFAKSSSSMDTVRRSTSLRSLADSESSSKEEYVDDPSSCNTCRKRYKLGKRWKHHCCRCLSTFCQKHGKVAHPIFTSCKVPGSCICQPCLDAEQKR